MMSITKFIGGVLAIVAMVLGIINSYLLYDLVGATTTMWVIFWVYLVMALLGIILSAVGSVE